MKYYKLRDLCTQIIDCPHSTPVWKTEGVRVIRNFNLKNGNLDFSDGYFVDEETYQNRVKRAIPEPDDIIGSCWNYSPWFKVLSRATARSLKSR